jgi:outer membrane immunogenic protein
VSSNKVPAHDLSGEIIGGTLGCNYQLNNLVLGVEGDWSWTNKQGSAFLTTPPFVPGFSEDQKETSIGTLRGRVGYAFSNAWMAYVTGGAAWARVQETEFNAVGAFAATDTQTLTGGTIGGGVEWMFLPQWSLKAEYLYVAFQHKTFLNGAGVTPDEIHLRDHIVRLGVNWKFWSM